MFRRGVQAVSECEKISGKCGPKFEIDEAEVGRNRKFQICVDFGGIYFKLEKNVVRKNLTVDRGAMGLPNCRKFPKS